ncbi:MAG TPA: ABC transporter substrate-binding protein, partial [Alphaproteobacteria bacterium]|nr:ABC transporter substrate-binding protein [Alphaproteobacteria bacterium]
MRHLLARGLGKALLGAALLAASLAATPASAETVLTRGFGASPDTLDPHMNFGAREGWIQDDIFEGLTAGNEKGEMVPGAAEKWESSDDGLTWTFHLRDGLKWSNGDPLVAQDFVNGVIRQLDPKTASPRAYYFSSLIPLVGGQEFIDAA